MITEFIDPIDDPINDFSNIPFDDFTDVPINDPADVFSDLHGNAYSQDGKEDLKDTTKSIVNPFFQDNSAASPEWDDGI